MDTGEEKRELIKHQEPAVTRESLHVKRSDLSAEDELAEMSFLDHLEELRMRLLWSIGTVFVMTILGFVITQRGGVIAFLTRPVLPYLESSKLAYLSPTEPIIMTFKVSFFLGLLLSLPVLFYHFWAFIAPALLKEEKRIFFPAIFFSVILFGLGVVMAFFVVMPMGLKFLLSFQTQSLKPMITIREYLKFATNMSLVFGAVFELPLVIVILTKLGIVTPRTLRTKRRYAIVSICIFSAILTPADILTMMMMCLPLLLLFEVSVWLSALIYRRRESELAG
ncbi:MAG: twin-arginine translocase subunit TatC [Candidatus Glassbacteria bacterium]